MGYRFRLLDWSVIGGNGVTRRMGGGVGLSGEGINKGTEGKRVNNGYAYWAYYFHEVCQYY